LICAVVVAGFVVYRWQSGDHQRALINIGIVATIAVPMLLGLSQRYRHIALKGFGSAISAGCVVSSLFVSNNGLLWALMVLLVNSLTLSRRWALGLNIIVIVSLSASLHLYLSPLHHVSWTTVAVLICGFSLMSMDQLRAQRQLLATQANVDPLTGVGNRRMMHQHLQEIVADRRRGQNSGTLMVLDLDHFKKINDNHGHDMGDQVLVEITRSIAGSLRAGDGFYRMGGEEFVILLRGMDAVTAHSYLPALHGRLSGKVSTADGPVTFSAGVATLQGDEDWSQWLARADRVLYGAKSEGRNQLRFSDG
jgi:diguanylate cyclase (GGDEF)-like protein